VDVPFISTSYAERTGRTRAFPTSYRTRLDGRPRIPRGCRVRGVAEVAFAAADDDQRRGVGMRMRECCQARRGSGGSEDGARAPWSHGFGAVSTHAAVEVPLGGGNITSGGFGVRNTVRRLCTASSQTEQLLRHLHVVGFEGAPRWLGVEQQGRDTFSYLPGRVAAVDEQLSGPQAADPGAASRARALPVVESRSTLMSPERS
jgi:hypothetical protein